MLANLVIGFQKDKAHYNAVYEVLNQADKYGDTCLHVSVKMPKVNIVQQLCALNKLGSLVNINLANNIKNTPLHVAAINNTVTLCKVLVGYNCDVLFKNNIDLNALEMAENFGNAETCEYLQDIVEESKIWSQKNCLAKFFVLRQKL